MIKRKPMEIPPAAALRFLADMRAFHSTDDAIKRDEIAAKQLCEAALEREAAHHRRERCFLQMRDQV